MEILIIVVFGAFGGILIGCIAYLSYTCKQKALIYFGGTSIAIIDLGFAIYTTSIYVIHTLSISELLLFLSIMGIVPTLMTLGFFVGMYFGSSKTNNGNHQRLSAIMIMVVTGLLIFIPICLHLCTH